MGAKTGISWCDATWSPIIGCSKVSAGCDNCYAERVAARFLLDINDADGLGYYSDVIKCNCDDFNVRGWNGESVRKDPKFNPLTAKRPRTIFVCSMGDLFHESVPDEWIDDVMAIIALTPRHRYMILTKRPDRMLRYKTDPDAYDRVLEAAEIIRKDHSETNLIGIPDPVNGHFWRNLALGVSIENQATADERVAVLLQTPAAKRFVSFEPALGPVDLRFLQPKDLQAEIDALHGTHGVIRPHRGTCDRLDLVIMGGETGANARPMQAAWARSMRDQCQEAGVPFHFKSWGEYCYPTQMPEATFRAWDYRHGEENAMPKPWRVGKRAAGRLIDGKEYNGQIEWEGLTC